MDTTIYLTQEFCLLVIAYWAHQERRTTTKVFMPLLIETLAFCAAGMLTSHYLKHQHPHAWETYSSYGPAILVILVIAYIGLTAYLTKNPPERK